MVLREQNWPFMSQNKAIQGNNWNLLTCWCGLTFKKCYNLQWITGSNRHIPNADVNVSILTDNDVCSCLHSDVLRPRHRKVKMGIIATTVCIWKVRGNNSKGTQMKMDDLQKDGSDMSWGVADMDEWLLFGLNCFFSLCCFERARFQKSASWCWPLRTTL